MSFLSFDQSWGQSWWSCSGSVLSLRPLCSRCSGGAAATLMALNRLGHGTTRSGGTWTVTLKRQTSNKKEKKTKQKKIFSTNSYFKKQTLLLQASEAGGRQAIGNGGTAREASILINETKSHTHYTRFKRFLSFFNAIHVCFVFFLHYSGELEWNQERTFQHHVSFRVMFCKICWFYVTFCVACCFQAFESCLFVHNSLLFSVFLASCVPVWLIGAYIWQQKAKKTKNKPTSLRTLINHVMNRYGADLEKLLLTWQQIDRVPIRTRSRFSPLFVLFGTWLK